MNKQKSLEFEEGLLQRLGTLYAESLREKYDPSAELLRAYTVGDPEALEKLSFGALKVFCYLATKDWVLERRRREKEAVENAFTKDLEE